MELTYTQCKQIVNNGYDLREAVEMLQDQPRFIEQELSVADIHAINQGGCASGAYMPAVTYATAQHLMNKYSEEIESMIEHEYECGGYIPWNISEETFAGFCVKVVSLAVETFCYNFADMLDGVDWD